jgi:HSP20 family protein
MALIRRRENNDSRVTRTAWDPFEMMQDLMRWDPFQDSGVLAPRHAGSFVPAFDVKETKNAYVLHADLPGMTEDNVELSLTGNHLTISGQRQEEKRNEDDKVHMYECSYGAFTRSVALPEGVDVDHIEAELKNGVLSVHIPKKPELRPRRIPLFGKKRSESQA